MPENEDDKSYFIKTIDTFSDIEGDMIIFKPLHRYKKPDLVTQYWNVLPDDKTSIAHQIADYAKKKGINVINTPAASSSSVAFKTMLSCLAK